MRHPYILVRAFSSTESVDPDLDISIQLASILLLFTVKQAK